jgi:methylmalonyl-CoA/ethylmalonyl-CoA epimerase
MKLHHIGKVVKDIGKAQIYYENIFGLKARSKPVIDPIQCVEVVFIETGHGQDLTIELIRPLDETSPVHKFLEKGGGFHHLCFEVENIQKSMEDFKKKGALILGEPVPGKGHGDKTTAWIFTPAKDLIELVERDED